GSGAGQEHVRDPAPKGRSASAEIELRPGHGHDVETESSVPGDVQRAAALGQETEPVGSEGELLRIAVLLDAAAFTSSTGHEKGRCAGLPGGPSVSRAEDRLVLVAGPTLADAGDPPALRRHEVGEGGERDGALARIGLPPPRSATVARHPQRELGAVVRRITLEADAEPRGQPIDVGRGGDVSPRAAAVEREPAVVALRAREGAVRADRLQATDRLLRAQ